MFFVVPLWVICFYLNEHATTHAPPPEPPSTTPCRQSQSQAPKEGFRRTPPPAAGLLQPRPAAPVPGSARPTPRPTSRGRSLAGSVHRSARRAPAPCVVRLRSLRRVHRHRRMQSRPPHHGSVSRSTIATETADLRAAPT